MTRPLVAIISLFLVFRVRGLDLSEEALKQVSIESAVASMVQEGELRGIYTDSQVKFLIGQIEKFYPELVEFSGSLSLTSEGREISLIGLHLNPNRKRVVNKNITLINSKAESVFFISYLISIDYVSVNAAVGALLNLVHGYANRDPDTISILESRITWVVPMLNVDAAEYLRKYYLSRNTVTFIYKNRKSDKYTNEEKCGPNGIGVNLNKNFLVGFNYDSDINTDDYPCSTNFGGVSPLSEAETKGLDDMLKLLKPSLVISIFTASKMITTPNLNLLDKKEPFVESYKRFVEKFTLYNELEGGVTLFDPLKHEKSSLYSKGGNIDEYLLYHKKIFPLNYYIGADQAEINTFLPKKEAIIKLVTQNIHNFKYLSCLAGPYVGMTNVEETYCKNEETCFPFLAGIIEKNYYGIKIRLADMGSSALPASSKICAVVPLFRNFYIDAIFDKNKKSISLENLEQSGKDPANYATACFPVGQLERFGDKVFYIIMRKVKDAKTDSDLIESQKLIPDIQLSIAEISQCNSMKLQGRSSVTSVSFDYQFYLYQEADIFVKIMVAITMGAVLLILCVKLFCCRKSTFLPNGTRPQDADDDDNNKLAQTRIKESGREHYGHDGAPLKRHTEMGSSIADPDEANEDLHEG